MSDDSHDLAARRGRPISEYGALFPDGRLWHWVLGVCYAGLVALEAIGNEAWRNAVAPYLDIGLFVALIASVWRWSRPRTRHDENAELRADMASLKATPVDPDLLAESGLLDENGKLIDETPPAWADELTPERPKFDLMQTIWRVIWTPALAFAALVALQAGLELVDWARAHWLIAVPVVAALVVVASVLLPKLRPDVAKGG